MTFKAKPTCTVAKIGEFSCAFCGQSYVRTLRHVPTPNCGKADCANCGQTMASWRSCTVPVYTPGARDLLIDEGRSTLRGMRSLGWVLIFLDHDTIEGAQDDVQCAGHRA